MASPDGPTRHLLDHASRVLASNLAALTLDEALFVPVGGYRSVLGTLKHPAGWSHVYHSFAFAPRPQHRSQLDWPRGLRDRVDLSEEYLAEVVAWCALAHEPFPA